jgi:predicted MPP superfamily phosphohydrolase
MPTTMWTSDDGVDDAPDPDRGYGLTMTPRPPRALGRRPFLASLAGAALLSTATRAQKQEERRQERAQRAHSFELTRPELHLRGLHEAHDGLVVGHLTDIHVGPRTPDERILAAVDALNAARPDIVFLTGDYVTRKGDPLERVPELLSRLTVPAVAVLGNHDHWTDGRTITRDLERIGIPVLQNAHTVVQLRGHALPIVGIDDAVSGNDDVVRAFKGTDPDEARLVLAHAPPTLDVLPKDKGLACFSGHTHGGQIFVEGLTDVLFARAGQHYLRGHYTNEGNQLYVSRGLGFGHGSNLPRVNADPEVAVVTLRRIA